MRKWHTETGAALHFCDHSCHEVAYMWRCDRGDKAVCSVAIHLPFFFHEIMAWILSKPSTRYCIWKQQYCSTPFWINSTSRLSRHQGCYYHSCFLTSLMNFLTSSSLAFRYLVSLFTDLEREEEAKEVILMMWFLGHYLLATSAMVPGRL